MNNFTINNQIIKNINVNNEPVNYVKINNYLTYIRPLNKLTICCTGLENLDDCNISILSRNQIIDNAVAYELVPRRSYNYSDEKDGDGDFEITNIYYEDPIELNIVPKDKEFVEKSATTFYTNSAGTVTTISNLSPLFTNGSSSSHTASSISTNMISTVYLRNRTGIAGYLQWKKSTSSDWTTVLTQVDADSETNIQVTSSGYYNTIYNFRFMSATVYETNKTSKGSLYEYSCNTSLSAAVDDTRIDSDGYYYLMDDNCSILIDGQCTETSDVERTEVIESSHRVFSQESSFSQLRAVKPPTLTVVHDDDGYMTLNKESKICTISNPNVYNCYVVGSVAGTNYNINTYKTISGNDTTNISYEINPTNNYELETIYLKDTDSMNTNSSTKIYFTRDKGVLTSVSNSPTVSIKDNSYGTVTTSSYPRTITITNNNSFKCYVIGSINGTSYTKNSKLLISAKSSTSINIDVSTSLGAISDEKIRFLAYVSTGDSTNIYSSYTTFNVAK